ncbi:hypothetical protein [Humidisolicoccus flavus]|uniref:hypothetical protein n=1 Tax=Humidisolicoccus flavus TaxID=3111414 RepID=UPI003253802E
MQQPTIDEILSGSRPHFTPSLATEAALDALVLETRSGASKSPRNRRRGLWLVPASVLGVAALTAGALVVDHYTRVELPVAIEYTSRSGEFVECTATIQGGSFFSPKPEAVIDYYTNHDFTGVGQQIYEYALVLSGEAPGSAEVLPDSVAWLPDENFEPYSFPEAFSDSMVSFLLIDVVNELGLGNVSGDADLRSDCAGQLR